MKYIFAILAVIILQSIPSEQKVISISEVALRRTCPSVDCTNKANGEYANPDDCGSFCYCDNGVSVWTDCAIQQDGSRLHFSVEKNKCDYPHLAKCEKDITPQSCDAVDCTNLPNGEYPNPDDCESFCYCVWGKSFLTLCPLMINGNRLHFNPTLKVCDWPWDAGCSGGGNPTNAPTQAPTQKPTDAPTQAPTDAPTQAPTQKPTDAPTQAPTDAPTQAPTQKPTDAPTQAPTDAPTQAPTQKPTDAPTQAPTDAPTQAPTQKPTDAPTQAPTDAPTHAPTQKPTDAPTQAPTDAPTQAPTQKPTDAPTQAPSTTQRPRPTWPTWPTRPTTGRPTTARPTTARPTTARPTQRPTRPSSSSSSSEESDESREALNNPLGHPHLLRQLRAKRHASIWRQ